MFKTISRTGIVLLIVLLASSITMAAEQDFIGKWKGAIDIQGKESEVQFNIEQGEKGLEGTVDVVSQGVTGLVMKNIKVDDKKISFDLPSLPGNTSFKGELKNESITGHLLQAGYSFDFEVKLLLKGEIEKVAQNNKYLVGEYDMKEKEVLIPTEGGNLAGTLTIPKGVTKPTYGVILVAGSGPTDRDGNNPLVSGEINTLKEIAHYLSSKGIVTLRYDKRGIKGSANLVDGATPAFDLFKYDLVQAKKYFQELDLVNKDELYILGHSEGAMLTIMAAEEEKDLAGIILISGAGYSHGQALRSQIENYGEQLESAGQKGVKEELLKALDDLYFAIRNEKKFDIEDYNIPANMRNIYLSLIKQPEFAKGWLDVDPVGLLENVEIPVCIIQGTNDGRVNIEDARNLASAVPQDSLDLNIFQGVNHYLKKGPTGNPKLSARIYKDLLDTIYQFIIK